MIEGISRRSFLGATAGSIASAAAVSAGIAHAQDTEAIVTVDDYSFSLNTIPSFVNPPAPVADADLIATYDYDIVIVGAGTAGLGAATAAHQFGAKTAVVQKQSMGVAQGNGGSGVDLEASDPAAIEMLINIHIAANAYRPLRKLVRTWVDYSAKAWNALADFTKDLAFPIEISRPVERAYAEDRIAHTFHAAPKGSNFAGATPGYYDAFAEAGIDVYYETPAEQLVQNEAGAVTGVICKTADGYVKFNAAKGVILTAGDYQNDQEMVDYFLPDMSNCVRKQSGKTGDGIKMGLWAGGVIEPVGHSKMSHDFGSGPLASEPTLIVNSNGDRFCCEGIHLSLMQNLSRFENPCGTWFQIFDSNYQEYLESWGSSAPSPEELAPYNPESDEYRGRGHVYSADTLEELAAKMGISDVENFVAQVARYNEIVAQGVDIDFGKDPAYLTPVDTAPFYGIVRNTGITAILSGLLTDEQQRVVNADGMPIPGLYAAGNNAGGFFGAIDYPFVGEYIDAISIGRAVTGGYAAVAYATGNE